MNRRKVLFLLGGATATWPFAAHTQRPGKARIGYLAFRSPIPSDEGFTHRMRELGWIEGQNITIERRFAAGDASRLKEHAAELVALKVDVIVAAAWAAAPAAKAATPSVPIVFANAGDPVGEGFVKSLPQPGGNITGIAFDASPDITAKQLQLLVEVVPKASRAAVLWNPASPFLRSYWEAAQRAAPALRVTLQSREVQDAAGYDGAFQAMHRERADVLLVLSDTFATLHRARITALAAKHGLPALYGHSEYVTSGGLMSYGPSLVDGYRRSGGYVDRILKGAKPADLPVEQPTKFELVINLKTAKALGRTIPQSVLARADEVIQ